tara:strand:+ start:3123 stop:3455 length:333 start_codon:yes stop_codon:yes gene_type:complete
VANIIKPKRSYTASSVPAATSAGEMSVNVADGKIWVTNAAGSANILVGSLNYSDLIGSPASASTPILENLQTVSTSKTLTAVSNGISLGPITVNTSVTVTIGTAQRWIIL